VTPETAGPLLDHIVGKSKQRQRHVEAERLLAAQASWPEAVATASSE
jgi:hypothetical protein